MAHKWLKWLKWLITDQLKPAITASHAPAIASQTPQRQSAINLPWPPEVQALGIEGMDTSPGEADNISPQEIYEHLKRSLPKHPVVPVEEDLEVPVVHRKSRRKSLTPESDPLTPESDPRD
jgi:hypothetical protein